MTTFAVLGPLAVFDSDGADVTPPGDLQRRLLSMLLLRRGHVVSADRLIDAMWPDGRAPGAAALHSHVSRLRKRVPGLEIEYTGGGYRLAVDDAGLDAAGFERSVSAGVALVGQDPSRALELLDDALDRWRGGPYADLAEDVEGSIEIERLAELHLRGQEERLAALVALGRAPDAVADLEALVARAPLRERPRRLLMDALSAAGRRAEALRVYDAYRRVLAEELGVAPSPELRRRHDELVALDDLEPPPDRSTPTVAVPPRPISRLFGRDDELAGLIARIGPSRLVTLIGPGGVGKTRLAVETAHRLAGEFADGVAFCDLTRVPEGADADGVGAAVCATLRIEPRVGVSAADRIAEICRTDETLLVLDNCEHVLDGAADLVERVLGTTRSVCVLATSRERLAVDGELLWPVSPLPCDQPDGLAAARALFADRAAAVGWTSALDDAAVAELCRQLDGLPLALELAAARLQALTLDEIIAGVAESMAVLTGGRRTVSRHRSLEAAIDWSYRLLGDDLREVLAAAAVFAAPVEAVDVAAVLDAPLPSVRAQLAGLVERSLVFRSGDRFRVLETIRAFVRQQLPDDRRAALMAAHARHVAERVGTASADLRYADDDRPIALIRHLTADVRQALDTTTRSEDAALALDLVVGCRDLAFDAMLPELLMAGQRAAELGEGGDDPRVADAFAIAAAGRWKTSDIAGMAPLLDRATSVERRLGLGARYEVWGARGLAALAAGDLEQAAAHAATALEDPAAKADLHMLAEGRGTLAICRAYAHDPRAADDVAILLNDVEPRAGAVPRSWCWYAAGECVLDVDPDTARQRLERAVDLSRAAGATFIEGIAATSLASLAVREGRTADAVELYRWLLPHWLRAGVASPFWTMLRSVTVLLTDDGRVDEPAARLLGAVTHPGSGHQVVGDDDLRLGEIRAVLGARLGREPLELLVAAGAELDETAAAGEAAAAFDLIG